MQTNQLFDFVQTKCSIPAAGLTLSTGDQGDLVLALKVGVDASLEPPGGGADEVGESRADPLADELIEGMPDLRFTTVEGPTILPPLLFLTRWGVLLP